MPAIAFDRFYRYDELTSLVPLALTEQRERMLDLVDRIVGAMVEESCPHNKTPDDWDWSGIREGFAEHFGISLAAAANCPAQH